MKKIKTTINVLKKEKDLVCIGMTIKLLHL